MVHPLPYSHLVLGFKISAKRVRLDCSKGLDITVGSASALGVSQSSGWLCDICRSHAFDSLLERDILFLTFGGTIGLHHVKSDPKRVRFLSYAD